MARVFVVVVAVVAVAVAAVAAFDDEDYANTVQITSGYDVFWSLNSTHVRLGLRVETVGWVGFGLAEAGGMNGADIVTAHVDAGEVFVVDRFAESNTTPSEDCQQDWVAEGGDEVDGVTSVQLVRLLHTGDDQDRTLRDIGQRTRVIAAFGTTDAFVYHGTAHAFTTAIDFFNSTTPESVARLLSDPNIHTLDLLNGEFEIPPQKTTYAHVCHQLPDGLDNVHVVAVQPVLAASTAQYVHHFILDGHTSNTNCGGSHNNIYGWAPGTDVLFLPPNVGLRLGPTGGGFVSLQLETHFDNPAYHDGKLDNSGVRLYYTTELREYDAGVFEMADPDVGLALSSHAVLPRGKSYFAFDCPAECTTTTIQEPITVFNLFLHMHGFGAKMTHRHFRDGELLREYSIEWYDFDFQTAVLLDEPFEVLPGDSFDTECFYDTGSETTTFGLGSQNEMCIAFMTYYPFNALTTTKCGYRICGDLTNATTLASIPRSKGNGCVNQPTPTPTPHAADSAPVLAVGVSLVLVMLFALVGSW